MKEYQEENRFDLVGELHLVVSLRNGAEIGSEADGNVVRVHLGHAALLRQVRQQGEEEGHHLVQITSLGFDDNVWTRKSDGEADV